MTEQGKIDQWELEAEMVIQRAKEEARDYGFFIDKIQYSGFGSQGDGASWEGDVAVPKYIEWKLNTGERSEAIEGIPNGILEVMYWLFTGGVFEYKLSVYRRASHYCHHKTMDLAEVYWTFMGANDSETMGQYGGPFADTPIKSLLQATQWSWEEDGHIVNPELFSKDWGDPHEYYRFLWEAVLNDARDFAVATYKRLENAYYEVYDLHVEAE